MKKQAYVVILSLVMCLVAAFAVLFAACGEEKEEVTVSISRTSLTIETGKSGNLTARASDGSEIVWTTSDEAVATVNNGKVTGVAAGTATITATVKDGEANATCEVTVKDAVTFTFKDADGNAVTEAEVDREGTYQLSATASDNSEITGWTSSDSSVATVSSTGLVTGLFDGEVTITVKTATGSGSIKITVKDTFTGVKYNLTDKAEAAAEAGQWWYYIALDGTRVTKIVDRAEFRNDVITFDFQADNWYANDVQLGLKASENAESGWRKLTGKINSNVAGAVTILGTVVVLEEGDNEFTVYYDQSANENEFYMAFDASGKGFITAAKVVVSDLAWSAHTVTDLATPSFTLSGNAVTVNDTANAAGVESYQIGLFDGADATVPVYAQNFGKAGGELDVSTVEKSGTYIVRIKAVGYLGFNSSAWSAGTDITYTVNSTGVTYDLAATGADGASANPGTWTYWAGDGGALSATPAYENGTIELENCTLGWAWYGIQLFYHTSAYASGTTLKVTMKITSTVAGYMTISGQEVKIEVGENDVEVEIAQGGPTLSIQFGVNGRVNLDGQNTDCFPTYTQVSFTVSDVTITEVTAE